MYKIDQIETSIKILKKHKHTTWYPVNWSTEDGGIIRNEIDSLLVKAKENSEMKKWNKQFESLTHLTQAWYMDFMKQYKNKYPFEHKLYADDDITCYFTIKDDTYDLLKTKEDIRERQWQYLKVFNDFTVYLHNGFLKEHKLFPKCLYE